MRVLVNGLGNIGTTLVNVLADHREALGISEIWALKNRPQPWQGPDLDLLRQRGIVIHQGQDTDLESLLPQVSYVFETREHGLATADKPLYERAMQADAAMLIGACAQGSEKSFGVPFMTGLNPAPLMRARFATIVSCNTHGLASILRALCGPKLETLVHGDAVVARRSEDLGSKGRLVAANVVARHLNTQEGSHYAIDAADLFRSQGLTPNLTSSDITTPSQALHGLRFQIELSEDMTEAQARQRFIDAPYISCTQKFDSAEIFALGRRYGAQGRLYSHAIVIDNQIWVKNRTVRGWAFVPQEGCTILSTIAAFIHQTEQDPSVIELLAQKLIRKQW